jgi:hypothetical protein
MTAGQSKMTGGQCIHCGTASDMLEQARRLLPLVSEADRDYLDRRIRTETMGDYGVEDLEG